MRHDLCGRSHEELAFVRYEHAEMAARWYPLAISIHQALVHLGAAQLAGVEASKDEDS